MAADNQTSDAERIAAELRANIRKARVPYLRRPRPDILQSARIELDTSLEPDLALLRANYDVAHAPFTSHRPVMGRLIILLKNIVREFLVQVLERQNSYNSAAVRAITHLSRRLDLIAQEQQLIVQRIAALESRFDADGPTPAAAPTAGSAGPADKSESDDPRDRA